MESIGSVRTCMLIRNDNHRLFEWLAYHYTVLPLRYIIVGSDINSTEDPMDVLKLWNGTELSYYVWYADDFLKDIIYNSTNPSRQFAERQAHFFLRCMQKYYTDDNRGWLALADTDEYIKLNPLDDKKDETYFPQGELRTVVFDSHTVQAQSRFLGKNETLLDRLWEKKRLRHILGLDRSPTENQTTPFKIPSVLEVMEDYASRHEINPCQTMARLQYSAVMDNINTLASSICHPTVEPSIASSLNVSQLTTMRYLYHYGADDFTSNRWGKVLLDLRRIPASSLGTIGRFRNPHAPIVECGRPPAVADVISLLRVNHYLNDFSVYTGRKGDPRAKDGVRGSKKLMWSRLAHGRSEVTCDHMAAWLNQFVHMFGIHRARLMLGQE